MTPASCKAARSIVNWSQQDLASRAGVSIGTVCKFETSRTGLRAVNLAALVGAFERVGVHITSGGHVAGARRPIDYQSGRRLGLPAAA
jgi:transcriptional regulator with XRE-family HTH domain